jgi:nicotinamidase-related amidase
MDNVRKIAINVDVQNDFCPGGTLAVENGHEVTFPLNKINDAVRTAGGQVVFTRDWHPEQTNHFIQYGGPWPTHCVAGTDGGAFHADLDIQDEDLIFSKGTEKDEDAYSGFQGRTEDGITLAELIRPKVNEKVILTIGGLATDYCVKATVLDALNIDDKEQIEVYAVTDAMKPVEITAGDGKAALEEMRHAGAMLVTAREAIERILG